MIDWGKFETEFVKLETGIAKNLKLCNWHVGSWFNMPGLRFDVIEEDSEKVNKVFNTTSKRLIKALKPIILRAESQGSKAITVSILRVGEGLNTFYEVKDVTTSISS